MGNKSRISILVITIVMFISLTSCHFGRSAEEMRPVFDNTKRVLDYSFNLSVPHVDAAANQIIDKGIEGLWINLSDQEDFAVFGEEFRREADTLVGDDKIPNVYRYSFNRRTDEGIVQNGNFKLPIRFNTYAIHTYGEDNATTISVFYPGSKARLSDGSIPKANEQNITLDFSRQCGRLDSLRQNYFYSIALGKCVAWSSYCEITDKVTDDDCKLDHHHNAQSDTTVILEPKVAVVRLTLTAQAQEEVSLSDYIALVNQNVDTWYISEIRVENTDDAHLGISRISLDVVNGIMSPAVGSGSTLSLSDRDYFLSHSSISRSMAQPLLGSASEENSWGTCLYLSIPCPADKQLYFDPLITVVLSKSGTNVTRQISGRCEPVTLQEGRYYITSNITCYPTQDAISHIGKFSLIQ